jgi:carbamoylphosphate synthase large subunit
MKKVLLVDTNFSSAPIYNYLIELGYEVYVIGAKPNDFLAKSVKNYINFDYSDIEGTRKIINEVKIDFIVPGCNDVSYKVCSELNSKRNFHGLDSIENNEIINSKDKFRAFASKIGLHIPRVIPKDQVGEIWPIIVKPVDAYSGQGMTVLQKSEQSLLQSSIDKAQKFSSLNEYLVEEYVEGQLYSHSAFIRDRKIVQDFIVQEECIANPFVVDTSRVIYDFNFEMLLQIRIEISLLAENLKLIDGLIHTQFIKNGNSFWLIEITRRCPGDLYSQLIKLSTGFNYAETYAKPFINEKFLQSNNELKQARIIRHTISQSKDGILGSLKFNCPIQIEKIIPLSITGDVIKASPFGRIAIVFLKSNTKEEQSELYQRTVKRNLYTIQEAE